MKTRNIVIIAIVSGIAIIALVIALVSCNKKAAPDVSSFSTANINESEVTTESLSEVDVSVQSEDPTASSLILQAEETNQEGTTETTKNNEVEGTTQQTSPTSSSAPASAGDGNTGSGQESPKATATPTPVPTKAPAADPTEAPKPTATPTPVPTATPTPEPTETPVPTSTPKPTPTLAPEYDPQYTKCIADVEYWAGQDNCYHGVVYGVPCIRYNNKKWVESPEGEDMVWDAIEAEHPDAVGYTTKVISGTCRNFS